jgi:hypothetical protein
MPKSDARVRIEPDTLVVGTAMRERPDHPGDGLLGHSLTADNSGYAAHASAIGLLTACRKI